MQFIPTIAGYADDLASSAVWNALESKLKDVDGIAFYRHPILRTAGGACPDLTVLARGFQPILVKCISYTIDDLVECSESTWKLSTGTEFESPFVQLEDFAFALVARFDSQRVLRRIFEPVVVVALPNITRADFLAKRPGANDDVVFIFQDLAIEDALVQLKTLGEDQWRAALSVVQNAIPLQRAPQSTLAPEEGHTIGAAMRSIDRDIALLDNEQMKVAHQMPPGPQRIRGLAGTGKTVLLAMRAANLHQHFPDKRILVTFWTQSLYPQLTRLDHLNVAAPNFNHWFILEAHRARRRDVEAYLRGHPLGEFRFLHVRRA